MMWKHSFCINLIGLIPNKLLRFSGNDDTESPLTRGEMNSIKLYSWCTSMESVLLVRCVYLDMYTLLFKWSSWISLNICQRGCCTYEMLKWPSNSPNALLTLLNNHTNRVCTILWKWDLQMQVQGPFIVKYNFKLRQTRRFAVLSIIILIKPSSFHSIDD